MLLHCTIKKIKDESGEYWMGYCDKLNISIAGETYEEIAKDLPFVINDILENSTDEAFNLL